MYYEQCDKWVVINDNDPDLVPIRINLLELIQRVYRAYKFTPPKKFPSQEDIDGYGMEPEEQYFRRPVTPPKLVQLESYLRTKYSKKSMTFIRRELDMMDEFWKTIEEKRDFYEAETDWIQRMWYHRLFGYYFFNNGKVTYITGAHFLYLTWWYLDNELPDYRDRDRRWFLAQLWAEYETRDFSFKDKEGVAIPETDGTFKMYETGRRVFYGTANAKARRVGDTSKAQCMNFDVATRSHGVHNGIQGKDDDNAEHVFLNHFCNPFKKMIIIFKPVFYQMDPKTEHVFDSDDPTFGLMTKVDFATSQDRSAYDGYKLRFYHRDEPGKTKKEDINKSHKVVKECSTLGEEISGFMIYTTTVDEMNQRGGLNYLKLAKGSYFNKRDYNGRTESGLVNVFFRASDGLKGFIDKFGMSVEDTPTPEQAAFIGKKYGAKKFLHNRRRKYEEGKNMEGLSEEKRLYPMKFRECFTPPSKNVFFRVDILEARITELRFNQSLSPRVGNLQWENGPDSRVSFIDCENGKFELSYNFRPEETNRKITIDGMRYPEFPLKFIASADAFRLEKTEGGVMSNGGGAVRWLRDASIDPDTKDISLWETERLIITYSHRPPTTTEYAEDMLMMCVFVGCLMYPEMNVSLVADHFTERGYGGYLLYDIDIFTGKMRNNPGWTSLIKSKSNIFNLLRDDIEKHGARQRHIGYLNEALSIQNMDEMRKYDLLTAAGGTLLGREVLMRNPFVERKNETYDVDWMNERRY